MPLPGPNFPIPKLALTLIGGTEGVELGLLLAGPMVRTGSQQQQHQVTPGGGNGDPHHFSALARLMRCAPDGRKYSSWSPGCDGGSLCTSPCLTTIPCSGITFRTTGRVSRSWVQVGSDLQSRHRTRTVPWYCPAVNPLVLNRTGSLKD